MKSSSPSSVQQILAKPHPSLDKRSFKMDEDKTEAAWIFAGERPRAASKLAEPVKEPFLAFPNRLDTIGRHCPGNLSR